MPNNQDAAKAAEAVMTGNLTEQGANYPRASAKVLLNALKAAGIAVVELPAMVGVSSEDNAVWCDDPHIEQEFSGDVIISDRLGIAASKIRTVAAALLAAADAADEAGARA